nr:phosphate/phosphite/phosphonate ABC transporter substrate-binding protein [uncultured Bacillus sp.]
MMCKHNILNFFPLLMVILLVACQQEQKLETIELTSNQIETEPANTVEGNKKSLNIGIASVISPLATRVNYKQFVEYIGYKLQIPVEFIQGENYAETNKLIEEGKIDVALVCSQAFVMGREKESMKGIVMPKVDGKPLYRSYIIVRKDSGINKLEDLQGKRFAYTDPDSYSGRLTVISSLIDKGADPEQFFSKTFYTYSHDYSVLAVAQGVVDGATVDSIVYDQMMKSDEKEIANLKVIDYGEWVGTPPIVVSNYLSDDIVSKVTTVLLTMDKDPKGKEILDQLGIEQFISLDQNTYAPINEMINKVGGYSW